MPTVATEIRLRALVPAGPAQVPARSARAGVVPVVRVRVWDLPTRVFHWALVASLAGLVATGYAGGAWIDWHARVGSLVFALVLFRVVWGVVGGRWSRFRSFVPSPATLKAYLQGRATPEQDAGHSPLGALSVLAMLAVLLAQVGSGLMSDDGGGFTGPLNAWVSTAVADAATRLHKDYGQWVLLGLVLLHVAAILFYRLVRQRKLVRAMLDGDKLLPAHRTVPPTQDNARTRLFAVAVFAGCCVAVGALTGF